MTELRDANGRTPLILAAQLGKSQEARVLRKAGADPNAVDNTGTSAIVYACRARNRDTAEVISHAGAWIPEAFREEAVSIFGEKFVAMLERNAQAKAKKKKPEKPFLSLVETESAEEVIEELQKNWQLLEVRSKTGRTPLIIAVSHGRKEVVQALLLSAADPNATDNSGATALVHACRFNRRDVAEILAHRGGRIPGAFIAECVRRTSSSFVAALERHVEKFEKSSEQAVDAPKPATEEPSPPEAKTPEKSKKKAGEEASTPKAKKAKTSSEGTPKTTKKKKKKVAEEASTPKAKKATKADAEQKKTPETSKRQRSDENEEGTEEPSAKKQRPVFSAEKQHLLLWACEQDNEVMVQNLLASGRVDVDGIDPKRGDGKTPLFIVSQRGFLSIVDLLLRKGASVDKAANQGVTPLFAACTMGRVRCARRLIEKGADVNRANDMGTTPLLAAAANGQMETCKLLLSSGAEVNKPNANGVTPLASACKRPDFALAKELASAGGTIPERLLREAEAALGTMQFKVVITIINQKPQQPQARQASDVPALQPTDAEAVLPFISDHPAPVKAEETGALCEECSAAKATRWCEVCRVVLCADCDAKVHSLNTTQRHQRMDIADRPREEPRCAEHGKKLSYFCTSDRELCCLHCREFGKHVGHSVILRTMATEEALKAAVVAASEAVRVASEASSAEMTASILCHDAESRLPIAKKQVTASFRELQAEIKAREQELLLSIDAQFAETLRVIEARKSAAAEISAAAAALGEASGRIQATKCRDAASFVDALQLETQTAALVSKLREISDPISPTVPCFSGAESIQAACRAVKELGGIEQDLLVGGDLRFREGADFVLTQRQCCATKTGKSGKWVMVLGNTSLPLSSVCRWQLRLKATHNSYIMVGIVPATTDTQKRDNQMHKRGWFLYCNECSLHSCAQGTASPSWRPGKKRLEAGTLIEVEVNTSVGSLSFSANNTFLGLAFTDIPLAVPLVPAILLYSTGDAVELLST